MATGLVGRKVSVRTKSGGGSSNAPGEAGVSCREDTRVAGGVVAAGAARAGGCLYSAAVCCLSVREGGWGREGRIPEGIWRPGELGSAVLFLTAGAVNCSIPPAANPPDWRFPRAHPGFASARSVGVRGEGWEASARIWRSGRVARWVAGPGEEMGRAWAGERPTRLWGCPESLTSTPREWAEGRRLARGGRPAAGGGLL